MAKEDETLKAELAATKEKLAAVQAELDAAKTKTAPAAPVEAHKRDTKGVRRYVVVGARAYVRGQLFRAGDVVTLQDGEVPSRTWRKLQAGEETKAVAQASGLVDPLPSARTPTL